jgi:GST-like protein
MLRYYTWARPNGYKANILLEELEIPYETVLVDLDAREQHNPDFVCMSPSNKIPVLVDTEGASGELVLFESGLIMNYLADKFGRYLPTGGAARYEVLKWLYWQVASEGPWVGIFLFLRNIGLDPDSAAYKKLEGDAFNRIEVLERRLGEAEYLGGDEYSIADMACYVVTRRAITNFRLTDIENAKLGPTPNLDRWIAALAARPGVQRGTSNPLPVDWITGNGVAPETTNVAVQ